MVNPSTLRHHFLGLNTWASRIPKTSWRHGFTAGRPRSSEPRWLCTSTPATQWSTVSVFSLTPCEWCC